MVISCLNRTLPLLTRPCFTAASMSSSAGGSRAKNCCKSVVTAGGTTTGCRSSGTHLCACPRPRRLVRLVPSALPSGCDAKVATHPRCEGLLSGWQGQTTDECACFNLRHRSIIKANISKGRAEFRISDQPHATCSPSASGRAPRPLQPSTPHRVQARTRVVLPHGAAAARIKHDNRPQRVS